MTLQVNPIACCSKRSRREIGVTLIIRAAVPVSGSKMCNRLLAEIIVELGYESVYSAAVSDSKFKLRGSSLQGMPVDCSGCVVPICFVCVRRGV